MVLPPTVCMGRPTHQSESSGEIFDFLIDEAAKLQLALCAFSRFLILGLSTLHTAHMQVKDLKILHVHMHGAGEISGLTVLNSQYTCVSNNAVNPKEKRTTIM